MKKFIISCLMAASVFVVPVAVSFAPSQGVLEAERRTMNEFPDAPKKLRTRTVREYFKGIERWFTDRVPARASFVALAQHVQSLGGGGLDMSKCVQGREDWLFLGNSYSRTLDVLEGHWTASAEHLDDQIRFYEELKRIAGEFGAELHILIGPNKASIYPEYLPPVLFPAKNRAAERLVEALTARGISVFDPTELLRASKDEGVLYWRTDTHWNELGVQKVLEEFLRRAGQPPLPKTELQKTGVHKGDLVNIGGFSYFPLREGDSFQRKILEKPQYDKSLLVLGDSFAGTPMPLFEALYRHTERVHMKKVFPDQKSFAGFRRKLESMERKPDLMFWIHVERNFVLWPNR